MLKKIVLGCVLLFFFSGPAWGFDALEAFEAPEALAGSFTQTKKIQDAGVVLKSEGRFALIRGKGIKWQTTRPVQSLVVIEGANICLDAERVPSGAVSAVAPLMQALFSRDMPALAQYFTVSRQQGDRVVLEAADETMAKVFSRMEIKGGRLVEQVVLHNRQGDVTTIDFFNVREEAEAFSCAP